MERQGTRRDKRRKKNKGASVSSKMNRRMWREEKEFMRDMDIFHLVPNLGTSYENTCIHISLV